MIQAMENYVRGLLEERVKLVRWHRQRACERQGIPFEEDIPQVPDVPKEMTVNVKHQGIPTLPEPKPPMTTAQKVVGAGLLGAAVAMGGSGLTYWLMSGRDEPAQAVGQSYPLLQWLEDEGQHLPDGGSP